MYLSTPRVSSPSGDLSNTNTRDSGDASALAADISRRLHRMMLQSRACGRFAPPCKRDLRAVLSDLHLLTGLVMDLEDRA